MEQHHRPHRRAYWKNPAKAGTTIRASEGIAHAFADFYHRLASGTQEQRQSAADFKAMLLSMGRIVA